MNKFLPLLIWLLLSLVCLVSVPGTGMLPILTHNKFVWLWNRIAPVKSLNLFSPLIPSANAQEALYTEDLQTLSPGMESGGMTRVLPFPVLLAEANAAVKEITPEEVLNLQSRRKRFYLIDVRDESEWNDGHCKGAIHIPRDILGSKATTSIPNRKAVIVLYCVCGYRSKLAVQNLQEMGYTNVRSMAGGIRSWHDKGFPEER